MDWKKLLYSAIAAVIVFLVLWFFGAVFNPLWVYLAFALTAGYLVYAKLAWWEIDRAVNAGKGLVDKVK